jgi:Spy/CpxP family protein refolding chaperone
MCLIYMKNALIESFSKNEKEDEAMIKVNTIKKFGLFAAAGLVFLGLTMGAQVYAADKGAPDDGQRCGCPGQPCDGPASHHRSGQGRAGKHHEWGRRLEHALKQLDLTDAQKASIQAIRTVTQEDMIQKRADLKTARVELREQLRKDTVNMSAVESQVMKLEGLRSAMMLSAIKSREKIKAALTPEQRKKLTEIMQGWKDEV